MAAEKARTEREKRGSDLIQKLQRQEPILQQRYDFKIKS